MNQQYLRQVPVLPHRYYSVTILPILLISAICFNIFLQASTRGSEGTQLAEVKFAVPPGFQLEKTGTPQVSFMRHSSEPLALFVTVPEQTRDDKYLTALSTRLVSLLFHGADGFRWKVHEALDRRVSKYQTTRGTIKGLNQQTFVQVDYVVVRVQDKDILIGSISRFGERRNAPFLFDVEGNEYSVRGWEGLFHLISSVTGEKDNEVR